jgi:signal transduction histidine kinase
MMSQQTDLSRRILVIDDNDAIHGDLRKILAPPTSLDDQISGLEETLFGERPAVSPGGFLVDSAYQGVEGLAMLELAAQQQQPYSVAFVDVRMPPGWDGIETTTRLWRCDPDLQVVLCTAYTDYSWSEIIARLGTSHNFVILKKPFENIEVVQLAHALTSKREATLTARGRLNEVETEVVHRKQTEHELLAALDAAESANRSKREFLTAMGHELRTPLNAIIGYTEMLEEDARQGGATELLPSLGKVQLAGRHLLEVINDILDMSRIESGRMMVHSTRVSAKKVAQDVIALAAPLAKRRSNRLTCGGIGEGWWIEADETRFRQCLLNLVANACKFTKSGDVSLEVVRSEECDGREWLAWSVRDTGIGIAEENFDKLFQPFSQVDPVLTRRSGGSGLGLAISQRLCAMMGGRITVKSKLGHGSTFTIHIPGSARPGPDVRVNQSELANA